MKNLKTWATITLMSITAFSFAQQESLENREEVQFGFKSGLNYSNVYNERNDEFTADSKLGFVLGAVLCIPISKYFGIQPELLFAQKGFKGEGTLLGNSYHFTRTTTYIDVPLQLAFKPSEFFTLVAGPQYSYLIKRSDAFTSSSISYLQEQEFKNDDIRKNILGFVAGIDIYIRHFVVGARLGWDIQDNNHNGSLISPQYKSKWFQGTVGYNF